MTQSTIFPLERVTIVAVLNLTPDSFSDGGRFVRAGADLDLEAAVAEAEALMASGAGMLDVGGESTRPGAEEVPIDVEIARTRPLIEALAKSISVPISIDTRKAAVAEAALEAGAAVVNDISGLLFDPLLAGVTARAGAAIILGHLRGDPATMQRTVRFEDVVAEVAAELRASADRALEAGIPAERIGVDPGIGFGKRLAHNLELIANLGRIRQSVGLPVLVGPSRKSFLGELTGDPVDRRIEATFAASAVAIFAGADAIRVHDVEGALQMATVARALREARRDLT
jgi:dihydropteroate synthase